MSNAKLASLLGLDAKATDWQILETVRNVVEQRDTYRKLAEGTWEGAGRTWEKVPVGVMIEHDATAWTVETRQVNEMRRVRVTLRGWWRGRWKTIERVYGFDDVATVLSPVVETMVNRLLRSELGARVMTAEEADELHRRLAEGDVAGAA